MLPQLARSRCAPLATTIGETCMSVNEDPITSLVTLAVGSVLTGTTRALFSRAVNEDQPSTGWEGRADMSSIRKMVRTERAAYDKYISVTAELIATETHLRGIGVDTDNDETVAKMRRRAAAYRAQWDAALRAVEGMEERSHQ